MNKQNITYTVLGLLVGILVTIGGYSYNRPHRDMSHRMPDGSMMSNMGMDMESQMHSMTSSLEHKTGDAFDKEFLVQMVIHHQGAVEMAQMVLNTSKRPELIQLANDIISAQNKEITMMKEWETSLFK